MFTVDPPADFLIAEADVPNDPEFGVFTERYLRTCRGVGAVAHYVIRRRVFYRRTDLRTLVESRRVAGALDAEGVVS